MAAKKPEKVAVTWFEALNEQATWTSSAKFLSWLSDVVGQEMKPGPPAMIKFAQTLRRIRLQAGNLHFGGALDSSWLNGELQNCRPGLFPSIETSGSKGSTRAPRLPAFRVDAQGTSDDAVVDALRLTLLLQFAAFAGDTVSEDNATMRIERCRGLYRDDDEMPDAATFPVEIEKRWRDEIDVLDNNAANAEDILRCGDFFVKTPKARFCSDACRFSTFQITKQLQEPDYLATKQKRYREKSKK
jgi:hypothetical protein